MYQRIFIGLVIMSEKRIKIKNKTIYKVFLDGLLLTSFEQSKLLFIRIQEELIHHLRIDNGHQLNGLSHLLYHR
jgi:hypothetical protein